MMMEWAGKELYCIGVKLHQPIPAWLGVVEKVSSRAAMARIPASRLILVIMGLSPICVVDSGSW